MGRPRGALIRCSASFAYSLTTSAAKKVTQPTIEDCKDHGGAIPLNGFLTGALDTRLFVLAQCLTSTAVQDHGPNIENRLTRRRGGEIQDNHFSTCGDSDLRLGRVRLPVAPQLLALSPVKNDDTVRHRQGRT